MSTILHDAALRYDLAATVNRIYLHGDESELQHLRPEQLDLYRKALAQPSTDKPTEHACHLPP